MDFTHLVENGTYSRDTLKEDQKSFLGGFEWAIEEIKTAADNMFDTSDSDPIYAEIVSEIKNEAAEEIVEWLYRTACEYIVCTNNDNYTEEENERNSIINTESNC